MKKILKFAEILFIPVTAILLVLWLFKKAGEGHISPTDRIIILDRTK